MLYSPSLREVRAGAYSRNLKAGTKAETVVECCLWLALHDLLSLLLYTAQDYMHRNSTIPALGGWTHPHQSFIKELPVGLSTDQSYETYFSIMVSLPECL